jgi:NRAMP (natural resistance-associated macrophage protein)-like metal ion transporter
MDDTVSPAEAALPDQVDEPVVHPCRPVNPVVEELRLESNPIKRLFRILGPGLVTGASDDDPSGIGTYAQAGAQYGYATLWTTILMLPMMSAVQYISAKIGLVTGRGLAGVLRAHYPRRVLYPAVFAIVVANTINAGADLGAIAEALHLLIPIPAAYFVIPVGTGILAVQIWRSYKAIERIFKWLAVSLMAYIGAALCARPNAREVLWNSFVPTLRLDPPFIAMLVALLGTTISPYLFFWQASHEVEEQISIGRRWLWQRRGATKTELTYALWDTLAGMILSEVVAYFIIMATGATLFVAGRTTIGSATEAAEALEPLAGEAASALLAIGLIGAGVLAVPILTGSAAYALSEAFGWQSGLNRPVTRAPAFYTVIIAATSIGMALNFLGINAMAALVITAIINGLLAPPILVLVMRVSNNRSIMGERTNGWVLNVIGWSTTIVMGVAAAALLVTFMVGTR